MSKRLLTLIAIFAVLGLLAGAAFAFRVKILDTVAEARKPDLPAAQPYTPPSAEDKDVKPEPEPESEEEESASEEEEIVFHASEEHLEGAMNLAIPFTPQAPHANWALPYQEACEESSLIMVNAWMVGHAPGLMSPEEADAQILKMVEWQNERFGYFEDTDAEETAIIAREYYGYENTKVLPVTSMEDVREQLENGLAVILPAGGRKLGNPFFRGQGPLYHMLVVKGFTDDGRVITNDPGTRRGGDFLYDPDVLYEAIGDWNDGDPDNGEKLMIVLSP